MGYGFRFRLIRPDGKPADPPELNTAAPSWRVGDVFPIGHELAFRVIEVLPGEPAPEVNGTLVVVPVDY